MKRRRFTNWWITFTNTTFSCLLGQHGACHRRDCLCDHHFTL